ncbi:AAA domain-containing protein [Nocardiopsis sp. CNR-923]|uniref:AAA domain-containing protein n=1 Tax=Nocardiopsis sp. CNR-923 TaxID=1904965 RepID=UPI00373FD69B
MGADPVIDPQRGYFLDQTRRMHPAVCRTVSELSYQGRLHAHPTTTHRTLDGLTPGVYARPVTHTGRTTHSPEEVDAVVAIATTLVGHRLTPGPDHDPRPLTGADILVVAPYNLQVRALRRALADAARTTPALDGIRVGTVDRFQGQEAAAVICSMTTSTPPTPAAAPPSSWTATASTSPCRAPNSWPPSSTHPTCSPPPPAPSANCASWPGSPA